MEQIKMKYKDFDNALDTFFDMEIAREQIETLWSLGHYDGPMTGLVKYKDKTCLATCPFHLNHRPRIFLMVEISEEKRKSLISWLEKRYKVAGNMKYNPDGTRDNLEISHMTRAFQRAIDLFRKDNPFPSWGPEDDADIVGWFRGWKL